MVQNIERGSKSDRFPYAPLADLQRLRSYSRRKPDGSRETWDETVDRVLYSPHLGLKILGKFSDEEMKLIDEELRGRRGFGTARGLWVQGTEWFAKPDSYPGSFNCSSFRIIDWDSFGMLMDLAMQGCGTGSVLELDLIENLPIICNQINVTIAGKIGKTPASERREETLIIGDGKNIQIFVGDSRMGWVQAYQKILELSSNENLSTVLEVVVDVSDIRPSGEKLKGFGGTANPIKLPEMFGKLAKILNKAVGRKLNSVECCLLLDEAALCIVAGNLRRSASMRQFSSHDEVGASAKDNLWQQDPVTGEWRIDPDRDALRLANHTRVFHHKPTLEECTEAVKKQFYSGEGAIQYAPEAIVRANVDLLDTESKRNEFLVRYEISKEAAGRYLSQLAPGKISPEELEHRLHRYGLNPCGEIIFNDGFCNLSSVHLNMLDPFDFEAQERAFKASALQAAAFLQRGFVNPRQQYSRELDPIVGVSFTGLFTFFVKAFGVDWLRWWEAGRLEDWNDGLDGWQNRIADIANLFPDWYGYEFSIKLGSIYKDLEQRYLQQWKAIVHDTVWEYCDRHNLKRPNRCTTCKPEGSLTLLTGVGSCGVHAPKSWRYIRRITFRKNDPIALTALDYGYKVVPSQSDKDENGKLLDDPFDPRCTEWLIEVPVEEEIVSKFPDAEKIDPSKFSALAQFDFVMQAQKHYAMHNVSSTIELRENEIQPLADRIYQAIQDDEGYISAALLARFDDLQTFPRLPFEPVSKEEYLRLSNEVLQRRKSDDFMALLAKYDNAELNLEPQDAACSSGACEIRMKDPND